jgi:hypothetical protein
MLRERVAIITGASRGIGRAIALGLAAQGCPVVIAAKSTQPTEGLPGSIYTVAQEVEALGAPALPVQVDVRDEEQIEGMVAKTLEVPGRLAHDLSCRMIARAVFDSGTESSSTNLRRPGYRAAFIGWHSQPRTNRTQAASTGSSSGVRRSLPGRSSLDQPRVRGHLRPEQMVHANTSKGPILLRQSGTGIPGCKNSRKIRQFLNA